MSEWFTVKVESTKEYLVEVEDGECPEDVVDYTIIGEWDEMSSEKISGEELDLAKRHTDKEKILSL